MAEFEYSLLIVHNVREVTEELVQLFQGQVPKLNKPLDMDFQFREYVGSVTIPTTGRGGSTGEQRSLIIHTAASEQDYRMFWRDHFHHAVLLNLSLPEDQFSEPRKETGMNLLKRIKHDHPESEVIVFTDQMIANRAIEAVKNGAFYFIQQPHIYLEFVQALIARIIQMMEGAYLDSLTGLYNRRFFQSSVRNFFEEAKRMNGNNRRRHNADLSLILIDLNDFKAVNDTYGHPEGDRVLRSIARGIERCFRKTDVIGRIGGDEFAVIVPNTDHRRALEAAERFRQETEVSRTEEKGEDDHQPIGSTISAGVATYPQPNQVPDTEAFVKAADEALYYAKQKMKKNVVCGYSDDGTIFSYSSHGDG